MTRTIKTGSIRLQFFDSLRRSGIKRGSRNWNDYEAGKKLIPAGLMTGDEYMKYVRWVTVYVGVGQPVAGQTQAFLPEGYLDV